MQEVKYYNELNNNCEEVLESLAKAEKYYKNDPNYTKLARAFEIARMNIETANMWINKGLYEAKENGCE